MSSRAGLPGPAGDGVDVRREGGLRVASLVLVHTDLHKAPLPGLQHYAGLLLTPADVMRLVIASEVLVQLAGTHEQESALQGLCPDGGFRRSGGQSCPNTQRGTRWQLP